MYTATRNRFNVNLDGGSLSRFAEEKGWENLGLETILFGCEEKMDTVYKTKRDKFIILEKFVHFNAHMNGFDSPLYECTFRYVD